MATIRASLVAASVAAIATLTGACKSDIDELKDKMAPQIQPVLDAHGKRLAPLLAELPPKQASLTPLACAAKPAGVPENGEILSLSRELIEQLGAGQVKALAKTPWLLAGESYDLLLGNYPVWSESSFEAAMRRLESDPVVGVFAATSIDEGLMTESSIERAGRFEGWFVLFDLGAGAPKVVARVPLTVETNGMIMVSAGEKPADAMRDELSYRVREAATKALTGPCAGIKLD